ncbi:PE-PGRS family protein PE_PGRS33-like [Cherax quadricarinatus]
MPTVNGGRSSGGGGIVSGGGSASPSGGGGMGSSGMGVGSVESDEDEDVGGHSRFLELVPPMIIVLVASLSCILVMALLVILLLKRRGRLRRMEQELQQVKLNKEMVFVHNRNPDTVSRDTPGSLRKGVESSGTPGGSSGGSIGGGGSGNEAGGGTAAGGIGGSGGGGGGVGGTMLGGGVGGGGSRVAGVGGGGVVGMVSSVDDGSFGSCNGDLLTTSSRDSLLGPRSKPGEMLETFRGGSTTLPILGIQQLGDDIGRHVVLEGLRPLGTALSTSCSSFRSGIPMGSMGGATNMGHISMGGMSGMMATSGLINTPSTSSSHLLQVSLVPENVGQTRGQTPAPRGNEGVSVL